LIIDDDEWGDLVGDRKASEHGLAGEKRTSRLGSPTSEFDPMLSKKSFGGNKRNFLKLLMRFVRSDMRDHIASQKNDHGPSYRH
jgi:hypothetical protein